MDPLNRRVVIVGAGQAGAALAFRLRENGHQGPISLIGDENWVPYQRPPLSKKYLIGEMDRDRLFLKPADEYAKQGIDLVKGRKVTHIDRVSRRITLDKEAASQLPYDILVLATGATPRLPDNLQSPLPSNVFTLRGMDDTDRMRDALTPGRRLLVVGGGYIGLELAAVATRRGLEVVLVEQAERILSRVACVETANYFRALHRKNGVCIIEGTAIAMLDGPADMPRSATLSDDRKIGFDLAVYGIGVLPNDELACAAGLSCDGGILVDACGRTDDPAIYAVGDCARFPMNGQMIRLESVHNAIAQAEHIANELTNPTGQPYAPVPWFWSDQYECKLQIAGLNHGYNSVVQRIGRKPGSVSHWYFREKTLVACDAINDARSFMLAKRWLSADYSPDAENIGPDWPHTSS